MPDVPSLADVRLTTPRLSLRPFSDADAASLYGMYSDARVTRYWSSAPWTSMDDAVAYIEKDKREKAAGEILRLGIERQEDRALIGTCALFSFEPGCRRAEIGYGLAPGAWGQGYAREAVDRLIAHAFDTLGLNRLEADIDPRNERSALLLERLGFRREGLLRERWIVEGEVSDSAIYGLLAAECVRSSEA